MQPIKLGIVVGPIRWTMLIVISILIIFNLLPKKVNDGKLCETVLYVMKCDDIQYIILTSFLFMKVQAIYTSLRRTI